MVEVLGQSKFQDRGGMWHRHVYVKVGDILFAIRYLKPTHNLTVGYIAFTFEDNIPEGLAPIDEWLTKWILKNGWQAVSPLTKKRWGDHEKQVDITAEDIADRDNYYEALEEA